MEITSKKPAGFIDRSPRGFALRNGLSIPTVYKLLNSGELNARKAGKRTIITEQDELTWLNSLPSYKAGV